MPKFIAFSGKKQCGKDTAATIVYNILNDCDMPLDCGPLALYKHSTMAGFKARPYHFAKTLKDMVGQTLGIPQELMWGTDEQKEILTHVMWEGFPDVVRVKYAKTSSVHEVGGKTVAGIIPRSGPMTVREVLQIMGTDIFRERVYGEVWAEAPFRQPWKDEEVVLIPDCRFPNEKTNTEGAGGLVIRINRTRSAEMDADQHESETALDDATFNWVYQNDGTLEELEMWLRGVLLDQKLIEV